jgi:hypothetical protein
VIGRPPLKRSDGGWMSVLGFSTALLGSFPSTYFMYNGNLMLFLAESTRITPFNISLIQQHILASYPSQSESPEQECFLILSIIMVCTIK